MYAVPITPVTRPDGQLGRQPEMDAGSNIASATAQANLNITQVGLLRALNRFQFAINLAQSQMVNTKGAESRIRDANIAEESANMTRYSILTQSGVAALAQANQSISAVLALLR